MKKLFISLLALLGGSTVSADNTPDFSHVTTQEQAQALFEQGKLFKILLFPIELGGEDTPVNTVYVPAGIPEIKETVTGTIMRFAQEGLIDNMAVDVKYKAGSVVPSALNITTSHADKPGAFNPTINIW